MRPISIARSTVGVALEGLLILAILGASLIGVGVLIGGTPGDAGSALAASENGRGHSTQAWLNVSGEQLASSSTQSLQTVGAGTGYTIVGGGFEPGVGVSINLAEPGCCRFFTVWPNADGTIAFTAVAAGAGTYEVRAFQRFSSHKLTLMASLTFEVTG